MWNEICSKIFSECIAEFIKNKIQYLILRNYDKLPYINTGKDVDIIVNPAQLKMAKSIVKKVYADNKIEYYDEAVFDRLNCMHGISVRQNISIHIDIIGGYRVKGCELFTFNQLYSCVTEHNGCNVLSEPMESIMLLIYKIFGYKRPVLKEKYKKQINEIYCKNKKEFRQILDKIFEKEFSEKICKQIEENKFDDILLMADEISKRIKRKCMKKNPVKAVCGTVIFIFKNIQKIILSYRKNERSFAVIAPDGTGKTTFLNTIIEKLKECYISEQEKFHVYHFRPEILPNLGELGEKAGIMKQNTEWTNPHRGKQAGFCSSLFRISYYTFDYILGYRKCVRRDVHYDRYSIFDRYSYDLVVDPARTKIKLPLSIRKIFVAVTPKPKVVFVLSADVETVYARKKELPMEEIKRQNEEYKRLANTSDRFYLINANTSVEELADKALEILLSFYGEKLI